MNRRTEPNTKAELHSGSSVEFLGYVPDTEPEGVSMINLGRRALVYVAGSLLIYATYWAGLPTFPVFCLLFAVTLLTMLPKQAVSPLTFLHVYYGVFYVVAPLFAQRYEGMLHLPEYSLSFAFAYSVYGLCTLAVALGETYVARSAAVSRWADDIRTGRQPSDFSLILAIGVLYMLATLAVALIVHFGGGLAYWLRAPGDAFLNRGGTGLFVIMSHFSSIALAAVTGYYAYRQGKIWPMVMFFVWVAITSPVHGSKLQIGLLVIIALLPWIRNVRLFQARSIFLGVALVGIFLLGLYFRNLSWISASTMVPYALNYFTALENLAVSVRDLQPNFMLTFFMPFVKFMTPFGLAAPDMYFDMNHYLTDIYLPSAWAIRATEQWPVETDLYLNFYFFGGLPLIAMFLILHGMIIGLARKTDSMGAWVAAGLIIILMMSHFRGSMYNHTDFYMYPYVLCLFAVMRRWVLPGKFKGFTSLDLFTRAVTDVAAPYLGLRGRKPGPSPK